MILAHLTVPLILYGIFPQLTPPALLALLVGANISSLDALPTLLRKTPPEKPTEEAHAATILHTLFFFAVMFVPVYFLFNSFVALSFTIGGFTHIFIDALDEKGRMLFYPVNKNFYGPRLFTYDFWTYTTDKKIFTLEASLFLMACVLALVK
jgi:membrane-bound metal-dependent hydrolase YbcI (DUF457 family)